MRINTELASRWVLLITGLFLLSACNSSYLSVKKADLGALDQCQQVQQSQLVLLQQQQARFDETLALLQLNNELQKQLLEMPRVVEAEEKPVVPAVVCPKLPKQRVVISNSGQAVYQDKQLVGEKERVLITAVDVLLRARIDTGMTTSKLDARNIQMFERNGEEWVRFTIIDRATDATHELERKRTRYVPTTKVEDTVRRPVVELRITMGKVSQSAEFILADRSDQVYPLLIGRNVLRDVMLVDVSRSDLAPVVREESEDDADKTEKSPANEKAN